MEDALAALARGEPNVLCLVGEPGVGKTRLASECAAAAAARGATVAWGRSWEGGGAPPLHPWRQALAAIGAPLRTGGDEVGVEAARFVVLEQIRAAVDEAGAASPLVVVLEDLHAADPASVTAVRYLAGALTTPVLLVATWRELELRADPERRAELSAVARAARVLALEGFAADELASYLEAHRAPADGAAVRAVAEVTAGNPLFVQTLLRRPGDPAALARAGGVEEAIRRWLDPLDPAVLDLLRLAAVIGREFDLEVLTELEGGPVLDRLAPALAMGTIALSGPMRAGFHHALIRETLYSDLPADARAELHVRVADALEAVHGRGSAEHVGAIAAHRVAGAAHGGADAAIDACLEAGARAARLGAAETARARYEQVLELRPSDPDRVAAAHEGLGRSAWAIGDRPAARAAFLALAETGREHGRGDLLAAAALGIGGDFGFVDYGVDEDHNALLAEAIAGAPEQDLALRARLLARLAIGVLYAGDPKRPVAIADEAVALAQEAGDDAALAHALAARRLVATSAPEAEANLALSEATTAAAQRAGILELVLRGTSMRCFDLLELGRVEDARAAITRYEELAERLRHPYFLSSPAQRRAGIADLQGDWEAGDRWLEEAVHRGSGPFESPELADSVRTLAYLRALLRGELAPLEPALREALASPSHVQATWRCALVVLLTEAGRLDEARAELERLGPPAFSALRHDPFRPPGLIVLAHAVPRLDAPEIAEALLAELEPYAGQAENVLHTTASFGAVSRLLGDLEASLERWDAAAARDEHARTFNRRLGAVPLVARCEAALAEVDRRRAGPAPGPATLTGPAPSFWREGGQWALGDPAKPLRLPDLKGLRHIRRLLEHPGVEIHALELAGGTAAAPVAAHGEQLTATAGAGAGPRLDPAARAAYRERVGALREEIDEAERFNDPERAARAREELDWVGAELGAAVGLGGRDRPAGADAERARVAVSRAIRSAIDRVAALDPVLGRRLEAEIRTGTVCSYAPLVGAVPWDIRREGTS